MINIISFKHGSWFDLLCNFFKSNASSLFSYVVGDVLEFLGNVVGLLDTISTKFLNVWKSRHMCMPSSSKIAVIKLLSFFMILVLFDYVLLSRFISSLQRWVVVFFYGFWLDIFLWRRNVSALVSTETFDLFWVFTFTNSLDRCRFRDINGLRLHQIT